MPRFNGIPTQHACRFEVEDLARYTEPTDEFDKRVPASIRIRIFVLPVHPAKCTFSMSEHAGGPLCICGGAPYTPNLHNAVPNGCMPFFSTVLLVAAG